MSENTDPLPETTATRPEDTDLGIVVGFDTSATSQFALHEAFRFATALGSRVTIVRAFGMATAPRPASMQGGYVPPIEDFEEAVRAEAQEQLTEIVADYPDVSYEIRPVHASPAKALIEASERARAVVVGRRRTSGLGDMILGSTSKQVIQNAASTVVVVKHRKS